MSTRSITRVLAGLCVLAACSPDQPLARSTGPLLSTEVGEQALTWRLVAPSGSGPVRIGTMAHAPDQRAIFAADVSNDFTPGQLWRFDLRTDRWSPVPTTNWPLGKYRRIIYDPDRRLILMYWDGLGQVYAVPERGGAWAPDGAAPNLDAYYEAYAFFNPATRRLSVFGGYGLGRFRDELWEWRPDAGSWQQVPQSTVRPEARFGSTAGVAIDRSGRRLFLGQRHQGAAGGNYDDLWTLDLKTNVWKELIPPSTGPGAQIFSSLAFADGTGMLYRFGGCAPITPSDLCTTFSNELLVTQPNERTPRWRVVSTGTSRPSPRFLSGFFFDQPRRRLVVVSGAGAGGLQDDVWTLRVR